MQKYFLLVNICLNVCVDTSNSFIQMSFEDGEEAWL